MTDEETRRKMREMDLGEMVDALDLQDAGKTTMAVPFDGRVRAMVDYACEEKCDSSVRRLVQRAPGCAPPALTWGRWSTTAEAPTESRYARPARASSWRRPPCTQYAPAEWHGRLGGGVQADARAERLIHGPIRMGLGDVNVRKLLSERKWRYASANRVMRRRRERRLRKLRSGRCSRRGIFRLQEPNAVPKGFGASRIG